MRKLLLIGCLSCLLILTLSACSRDSDSGSDDNIVYGQVVKTDENKITVESGSYTYGGSFKSDGEEKCYNLPENVFYDDFKAGDIVSILCDGEDATAVTNVKDVEYRTSSGSSGSGNSGSSGSSNGSGNSDADSASGAAASNTVSDFGQTVQSGVNAARLKADDESVTVNDEYYEVGDDMEVGLLALNSGGKITANRTSLTVSGKNSCGIAAENGAAITGEQINLSCSGENSIAAATLDGSSVIDLSNSTVETESSESPCVISAGNVSLTSVTLTAQKSSGLAVLPGGVVNLKNSSMTTHGDTAVELCNTGNLQSGSQSSGLSGRAKFMANSSSLEAVSNETLIQVTGIESFVKMMNTSITSAASVLADVQADEQKNGAKLLLYGVNQEYSGDITCDEDSKVKLVLTEESSYTGCFDADDSAKYSKVYISKNSKWDVTGDSHVGTLRNGDKKCRNIQSDGYTVYYDKNREANDWLEGKTISLPGGGKLQPE